MYKKGDILQKFTNDRSILSNSSTIKVGDLVIVDVLDGLSLKTISGYWDHTIQYCPVNTTLLEKIIYGVPDEME